MTETLPVGWDGIPGVFDLHVMPRFEGHGHGDVGCEEHSDEEGKRREPAASHEEHRSSTTNVQLGSLEDNTKHLSEVQRFYHDVQSNF